MERRCLGDRAVDKMMILKWNLEKYVLIKWSEHDIGLLSPVRLHHLNFSLELVFRDCKQYSKCYAQ